MLHTVLTELLLRHPNFRDADCHYFPEAAPATAGDEFASYAHQWNALNCPRRPRVFVVHENGKLDGHARPGVYKNDVTTANGVIHLQHLMRNEQIKVLDTKIFITNMQLPTTLVDEGICRRELIQRQTREQFLRYTKKSIKRAHDYDDEKDVYTGKAGTLQDDAVIPFIMMAYWMDVKLLSPDETWREISLQREHVRVGQPRFFYPAFAEETKRLLAEGKDIHARERSAVIAQTEPLPTYATAKRARDTREDWPERKRPPKRTYDDDGLDEDGNQFMTALGRKRLAQRRPTDV